MLVPKGNWLTIAQYCERLGVTRTAVLKAIKDERLKGVIWLDKKTVIIPEDAILISHSIRHGRYIGVSAWLRGEVEHQEEVKAWEMRQAQLRKMREKDL